MRPLHHWDSVNSQNDMNEYIPFRSVRACADCFQQCLLAWLAILCCALFQIGCGPTANTDGEETKHTAFASRAIGSTSPERGVAAVSQLTDHNQLLTVAEQAKRWEVRHAAILQLKTAYDPAPQATADITLWPTFASDARRPQDMPGTTVSNHWATVLIKTVDAFHTVPGEHRVRLMDAVLPAIRFLGRPEIVAELGDIRSVGTHWEQITQSYYGGTDERGEVFYISISGNKNHFSATWRSQFVDWKVADLWGSFNPATIRYEDLMQQAFEILPNNVVLQVASDIRERDSVRNRAKRVIIMRIGDPVILKHINVDDKELQEVVRDRIAVLIDNQRARLNALDLIHEQSELLHIALHDEDSSVRIAAIGKLSHQNVLADLATGDIDWESRYSVLAKVFPSTRWAIQEIGVNIRFCAAERLDDQTLYQQMRREQQASTKKEIYRMLRTFAVLFIIGGLGSWAEVKLGRHRKRARAKSASNL